MDSQNRISNTSITPTVARQTPKRDFGDELVNAASTGARIGVGIVGSAVGGNPVVSAAVSGISGAVSLATSNPTVRAVGTTTSGAISATSTSGATATGGEPSPVGGGMDVLAKQEQMNQESQAFSAMYLQLQDQMQKESREYNAISNIIKVRHDSAKSAINNIR